MVLVRKQERLGRRIGLKLAEHPPFQGPAAYQRLLALHSQQAWRVGQVGLPAAEHHCVPLAHQEPVARIQRRRVIGDGRHVVETKGGLAPPVDHVKEQPPVALARLNRLEQGELGRKDDLTVSVPGSQLQVGDRRVAVIEGVYRKMGNPVNTFIRANIAKGLAIGEAASVKYL